MRTPAAPSTHGRASGTPVPARWFEPGPWRGGEMQGCQQAERATPTVVPVDAKGSVRDMTAARAKGCDWKQGNHGDIFEGRYLNG